MVHALCVTNLHTDVQQISTDRVQKIWKGPQMQTIGQQLKALRSRTPHTVRSAAKFLGFDNHSRYSYYEGSRFKKPLPLEMARQLAELFYRSGKVEPREVLALAGLSEAEADVEEKRFLRALRGPSKPQFVRFHVQLPSEEALTEMFAGMLEVAGRTDLSVELAEQLAQLLPAALSVTPNAPLDQAPSPESRVPVARLLRDARDGLALL